MIDYQIIRSRRRKRTTMITVNPERKIIVKAPLSVSERTIHKLVQKNKAWIKKRLNQIKKMPRPVKKKFVNGEKFLYFGSLYPLEIKKSDLISKPKLKFSQGRFQATIPQNLTANQRIKKMQKLFLDWYLENGLEKIEKKAKLIAKKLKVKFNKIKLKNVSSRWGSCSSKGNLSLNWRLAMIPTPMVNYILIHEICHLIHPNHSQKFWQLVASLDPDYKQHQNWLKNNYYLFW